jgi:poly-gamma-glutamate capsule biosynthesis protein CapA/YwtB (metallophosphatase superfamily)
LSTASILAGLGSVPGPPKCAGVDASRLVQLTATGDIIPARHTNAQMVARKDFLWPVRQVKSWITGDIVFVDLESPLVPGCPTTDTGFKFCGDPRFIDALTGIHADVANLSNNHLTNYGPQGTDSTIKLLTDHGIQPAGLGFTAHVTVKGTRFAFLGFNGVGVAVNRAEMKREIDGARPGADVVVVQFHWGKEYVLTPRSTGDAIAPDNPREIGKLAIDDGADLVIGNHPHGVQGFEMYRGKLITYAHGNLIFDQMWTPDPGQEDPRNGVLGNYYFEGANLVQVGFVPYRIYEYGQPRVLADPGQLHDFNAEGMGVLGRLRLSTETLAAS